MSELELSLFRQRSQEALRQKARRGALFLGVAAGYVKTGRDRIEKDPDQQVRAAVGIVFAKFAELHADRRQRTMQSNHSQNSRATSQKADSGPTGVARECPLPAHLTRPRSRSATSAIRRFGTFDRVAEPFDSFGIDRQRSPLVDPLRLSNGYPFRVGAHVEGWSATIAPRWLSRRCPL